MLLTCFPASRFSLSGEASRNCGPTGQWESPAPECIANQCELNSKSLTAVQKGPYLYSDRVSIFPNFVCNKQKQKQQNLLTHWDSTFELDGHDCPDWIMNFR